MGGGVATKKCVQAPSLARISATEGRQATGERRKLWKSVQKYAKHNQGEVVHHSRAGGASQQSGTKSV